MKSLQKRLGNLENENRILKHELSDASGIYRISGYVICGIVIVVLLLVIGLCFNSK